MVKLITACQMLKYALQTAFDFDQGWQAYNKLFKFCL